ncbi:hypothetical protein Tco_0876120 [Tanacetum coccineum]|uniref:Uncharacterized protein n=1 Tax=Tanacetum coccineum TaxID=301880 RepID=A0ABQ5BWD9_9ASTR
MDDTNITMEEYIRLEEEKARKRAIAFNDTLMSEPTVSSLNNEIDFRISFDESDDGDYTVALCKCSSTGRPLGAYNLGVATPRALVYAGLMTSGDARSWYMISGDAKSWV